MTDINRPRRGTMGVRPRKRAESQNARVFWQDSSAKRVLGFAGYKVGMTTVSYIDNSESPTKGQEITLGGTIIEIPPMHVYGVRFYNDQQSLGDTLVTDEKVLKMLNMKKFEGKEPAMNQVTQVRLLAFTEPAKTSMAKKHIERMEIAVGGKDASEKIEYAKSLLGKPLLMKDVFKAGDFVDIIAITKGKGWQGAVKRFGIAKQRRKATGKVRHVGTLGQWHPAYVLYTVPQAGQTGYHKRTEFSKQIIKMGENVDDVNPKDGFTIWFCKK